MSISLILLVIFCIGFLFSWSHFISVFIIFILFFSWVCFKCCGIKQIVKEQAKQKCEGASKLESDRNRQIFFFSRKYECISQKISFGMKCKLVCVYQQNTYMFHLKTWALPLEQCVLRIHIQFKWKKKKKISNKIALFIRSFIFCCHSVLLSPILLPLQLLS